MSTPVCYVFFFNDTATTEIYTLSLHDALPISKQQLFARTGANGDERASFLALGYHMAVKPRLLGRRYKGYKAPLSRSEEHTSELQSRLHIVCRLLLEKKKNNARLR